MFENYRLPRAHRAEARRAASMGFKYDPKEVEIEQNLTVYDLLA